MNQNEGIDQKRTRLQIRLIYESLIMISFQVILFLCGLTYGNNMVWNSNGTVQCYECESVNDKVDEMNQGCWILEHEGEPLGDGRGTCLGLR